MVAITVSKSGDLIYVPVRDSEGLVGLVEFSGNLRSREAVVLGYTGIILPPKGGVLDDESLLPNPFRAPYSYFIGDKGSVRVAVDRYFNKVMWNRARPETDYVARRLIYELTTADGNLTSVFLRFVSSCLNGNGRIRINPFFGNVAFNLAKLREFAKIHNLGLSRK